MFVQPLPPQLRIQSAIRNPQSRHRLGAPLRAIGFVLHFTLRTSDLELLQNWLCFAEALSDVQFTITPFPQSTYPSARVGGIGFVCTAPRAPHPQASPDRHAGIGFVLHDGPPGNADLRIGIMAGIGFVWHDRLSELGLFVQPPRAKPWRRVSGLSESAIETLPRCPASGNWLCFAATLYLSNSP